MMSWKRKLRRLLPQEIQGPFVALYERIAIPGLAAFHQQVAADICSSLAHGRVLDVGTGPAHLLVEIARRRRSLKLTGVDLSPRMLRIARTVTREAMDSEAGQGPANGVAAGAAKGLTDCPIELALGDVCDLPFDDGAFDLVVSTLSLHHWHRPVRGIQECLRVTAPGGQCWIYDLRTDVPARQLAGMVTGGRLRRLILGRVFKFHGVRPEEYVSHSVAQWLDGSATVEAEVRPTYLKLTVKKSPCELRDGAVGMAADGAASVGMSGASSARCASVLASPRVRLRRH